MSAYVELKSFKLKPIGWRLSFVTVMLLLFVLSLSENEIKKKNQHLNIRF